MELYIENDHPLMELLLQRAAEQELSAEEIVVLAIWTIVNKVDRKNRKIN